MFDPGDLINERYEVIGLLGQGGMAHVFRVRDRVLERDAALKVLRPHLTEADSGRFRREIRALAQLNHPGVVSIFDLGRSDLVYFVMELVAGGPVTDLGPLEGDPEALARLLDVAIDVANTLGYIHRLGMVHRDLTPRNILLTSSGQPKVMDFGLVLLTETSQNLTKTGLTLGTPHYMAPEQATGTATGFQADLYAFGAVLYKMITGVAPFDADNDQAVLYHHVYTDLTPATELNHAVPESLELLLGNLLEKTPEARPGSSYAVADSLQAIRREALGSAASVYLGGYSRQGYYPDGPAAGIGLTKRWSIKLASGPQWPSGLGTGRGHLLVGQRFDKVTSLWLVDGQTHLEVSASDEVYLPPQVHNGRLYVASRDGNLQVRAWPQGDLLANHAGEVCGFSPFGTGLILAKSDGTINCSDNKGETIWESTLPSPAMSSPVVHRNSILLTTHEGWLHCLDPKQGRERFRVQVGPMRGSPVGYRGVTLLSESGGALHAFDLESRNTLWSYDFNGPLWASPAAWNGMVFSASWGKDLRCLNLKTGEDVWEIELSGPVTATPVLSAGVLYVTTEAGQLLGFEARTGTPLFSEQISANPIQASPLITSGRVYVASLDGTVSAFETSRNPDINSSW
jgi:outer membrane protein assembly factor BamB